LRDRQNRFYERGYQHIYEGRNGAFIQGTPGAVITTADGADVECPTYIGDYNIFQPFERTIESVLTQNPPGVDFQPDNSNRSEDMEAAETAEGYRKFFNRANDVKGIQTDIVRMMCLSGRTVAWTRTEANAEKWGLNDSGQPKQQEISTIHGTLEHRCPLTAVSQEKMLYQWIFDDPDVKQAKSEYPHVAKKIKVGMSGIGESQYERTARLGTLMGSRSQAQMGDAFSHLVTRMFSWFRPNAFTGDVYDEQFEEDPSKTVGEVLRELFPEGCRVVFCGDVYCEAIPESMDDHLTIGFPYKGDGQYRLAIMDSMVVVQDTFNDNCNVAREVFDMGQPSTWINCTDQDYAAINSQISSPYAIRQIKIPSGIGAKVEDQFFREPNPDLSQSFMDWNNFVYAALPQFQLACPPAIFGAAMQDQKTASGYAQPKAQAMGQQAIWFGVIQQMFSRIYFQAALCATKNPDHARDIVVPGDNGSATINLQRLTKGKFNCYPDEDQGFPESTEQKRATMGGLLDRTAQDPVAGAMFLQSPDNMKQILSLMGFPELKIAGVEARDKQIFEIELLLQQSPIPPSPEEVMGAMEQHAAGAIVAQDTGQPEQPAPDLQSMLKSSVPVGRFDFHEFEFQKCKEWLSSEACRREIAQGNQAGVQNVELHCAEHEAAMQQAAMQAQAMMPQPEAAPNEAPATP
jgi:hypothetical protein